MIPDCPIKLTRRFQDSDLYQRQHQREQEAHDESNHPEYAEQGGPGLQGLHFAHAAITADR